MPTPENTAPAKAAHRWTFVRSGGVDQVILRTGDEIANLELLDLKLWMALAMPTRGVEFDPQTADVLDTDKDGRIRPPEVLAAVRWAREAFTSLDGLLAGGDAVPLASIRNPDLLAGVRRILTDMGKPEAGSISLDDVANKARIYACMKFNGDGIIPPEAADDEDTRKAIGDIMAAMGPETDRGGEQGVSQAKFEAFFSQAAAFLDWAKRVESEGVLGALDLAGMTAAREAVRAVQAKLDDYFTRCRLAAYDERSLDALNRAAADYAALADQELTATTGGIAAFPVARIAPGQPLPLGRALNPAWEHAIATLNAKAITPLLGARAALSEADWRALQAALAPFESWLAARPDTPVAALGAERLRELLAGPARARIGDLIARDTAVARETAQFAAVEKMVRFQRDLFKLLTNFINFADFYGGAQAVFQTGRLYLDARACDLCIEVADIEKHAALAGRSGAFLAYCRLTRPGGQAKHVVAVITGGDADNLMVGRNGVFYDRQGRDWDAAIVKIVSNPISVREAFWMPYKKLARFIEDQVAKRAQAGESASLGKLSDTAAAVAGADKGPPAPAPVKKLDLGTIALIGTAIGGISALVGGFLQALFGLGFWLPLGLVGVLLLISGPSMLLAWLKLRLRNLGPVLDANGWAINTRAKMNAPFGAALTQLARLPPGANRKLLGPYAVRKGPRWWLLAALVAALLAALGWAGFLDGILPPTWRRAAAEPGGAKSALKTWWQTGSGQPR